MAKDTPTISYWNVKVSYHFNLALRIFGKFPFSYVWSESKHRSNNIFSPKHVWRTKEENIQSGGSMLRYYHFTNKQMLRQFLLYCVCVCQSSLRDGKKCFHFPDAHFAFYTLLLSCSLSSYSFFATLTGFFSFIFTSDDMNTTGSALIYYTKIERLMGFHLEFLWTIWRNCFTLGTACRAPLFFNKV